MLKLTLMKYMSAFLKVFYTIYLTVLALSKREQINLIIAKGGSVRRFLF